MSPQKERFGPLRLALAAGRIFLRAPEKNRGHWEAPASFREETPWAGNAHSKGHLDAAEHLGSLGCKQAAQLTDAPGGVRWGYANADKRDWNC